MYLDPDDILCIFEIDLYRDAHRMDSEVRD